MKIKTDEIAAIQAIRACMEEIPFLHVMEVSSEESLSGPDFRIEVIVTLPRRFSGRGVSRRKHS
ncbi:MAG: hypothetical protein WAV05_08930 [Anaerolineales bacterium]